MRKIIEIACPNRAGNYVAGLLMWLLETQEARKQLDGILKHIAHVMKQHKIHTVTNIRQSCRWQSQFKGVDESRGSAHRITSLQVPRPGTINSEPSMRVGATRVKTLRQRYGGATWVRCEKNPRALCVTHIGVRPKASLEAHAGITCKNIFTLAKEIVSRVRDIDAIEIRLRTKFGCREEFLHGGIRPLLRIQRSRLTRVVEPRDPRSSHPHRLRKQRNKIRGNLKTVWIHFHAAILEIVNKRVRAFHFLRDAEIELQCRCFEGGDVLYVG